VSVAAGAVELLPPTVGGRVHADRVKVRLGDVDRVGRLRLDATARLLQDIATDDADAAGLDRRFGWLVRRTKIVIGQTAKLGERLEVSTWCTGIGRSWAERRSRLVGDRGAEIDAVSLWVQIDVATGRPARVGDDFRSAYAAAAAGRTVSSRLALAGPTERCEQHAWTIRRTDLDPFDHVNNASTWAFLEEVAMIDAAEVQHGCAEMEYLQPATHGVEYELLVDRHRRGSDGRREPEEGGQDVSVRRPDSTAAWLVRDGVVHAAARWTPSEDPPSAPSTIRR
jgi:acyl-ACP thioesterase